MARGIEREPAMIGASQVVLGAARMVQQTGRDPKDLERLSASLCTLHEEEVRRLYTDAYEEALRKLRRVAATVGA
jgi:pyrroline-5-carboxylate reductase